MNVGGVPPSPAHTHTQPASFGGQPRPGLQGWQRPLRKAWGCPAELRTRLSLSRLKC